MTIIKDIIYSYIVGDSYGLSLLHNNYDEIKLYDNKELNIEKGSFSSMTTFMLSTMDSITKKKKISSVDIINKMCTSLIVGKYTNQGKVYDLDNNTLRILKHYNKKNNLTIDYNELDTSSYALSRLIPLIIFNYYTSDNLDDLVSIISLTNINEEVLFASFIYYKYMLNLLDGKNKFKALKLNIPQGFNNKYKKKYKKKYKNILKNNIYYKDIIFDDNVLNVLSIVFYVILNTDNFDEVINMCKNIEGNTNIYYSLIFGLAGLLYGKDNIDKNLLKDLKNKKEINKYINDFRKVCKNEHKKRD